MLQPFGARSPRQAHTASICRRSKRDRACVCVQIQTYLEAALQKRLGHDDAVAHDAQGGVLLHTGQAAKERQCCLLYTSDAADD